MIFPDATTEEWCKKYGLKVKKWTCSKCGCSVSLERPPYIDKNNVGFCAIQCPHCLAKINVKTFRPYSDEARELWASVLG